MSTTLETETSELVIPGYSNVDQHTKKTSMSIILETNENRRTIPVYSDETDVDQHTENSLDFAMKNVDAAMQSRKPSDQTEDVFSADQTESILRELRSFTRDGLKITNCILRKNEVEFCYIFNGASDYTEDVLRQELADHLRIKSTTIKMTKLRAKPIYKETTLTPGETANHISIRPCKIGAYVDVEGIGNHALMSGHGRRRGDVLFHPNGNLLGVVNVSLPSPLVPRVVSRYEDVALAKLEQQNCYTAQVPSADHGQLCLEPQPAEATQDMSVRCFDVNGRKGTVDSTAYSRHDEDLGVDWIFTSVKNEEGEPIHADGDSGTLIVHDAPNEGRVRAVGMLVGIEALPLADPNETTRRSSLAVPLTSSFKSLEMDPYCSQSEINFLH